MLGASLNTFSSSSPRKPVTGISSLIDINTEPSVDVAISSIIISVLVPKLLGLILRKLIC